MSGSVVNDRLQDSLDRLDEAIAELVGMMMRAARDARVDDMLNLSAQVNALTAAGKVIAEHVT